MKKTRRTTEEIIRILRDLEKENGELKKLLANQLLKAKALEIALEETYEPGGTVR